MGVYQDFIPDGDDVGALGAGFTDFVPEKQTSTAKKEHIVDLKPAEEKVKEKKG